MTVSLINTPSTVDGLSRVFDDESAEWIHYISPSDALIAKLYLESRIPARYIDAFLNTLHNPNFIASELSFGASTDIDKSVAEYRQAQAFQRSLAGIEFPSALLPYDIFALIVDAIMQERQPLRTDDPSSVFGKLAPGQRFFPDRIASRLKALALTHRALTPLAQRALGQRIFVQKANDLRALARSPLLGPWTTELLINLHFASPTDGEFSGPEDVLNCVSATVQRAKKLKFLRIRTPSYLDQTSTSGLRRLLEAVQSLEHLETLWLIAPENASRFARMDLEDVCQIITRMPRLQNLVIRNAKCGWIELDEINADPSRTHHLEELSLTDLLCPAGPLEATCLSWFLKSSSLKSLTLGLDSNAHALESLLTSSHTILRLQTIRLKLTRSPSPGFFSSIFFPHLSTATLPLDPFPTPNLHALHLSCEPSNSRAGHDHPFLTSSHLAELPHCLRSLHLGFFHLRLVDSTGKEQCRAQEDELVQSLSGEGSESRTLDELEVSVPIHQNSHLWSRLREVCKEKGCRFNLRKAMQAGF